MRGRYSFLSIVAAAAIQSSASAGPILFDFIDTTAATGANKTSAFDGGGVGATATFSDGTTSVTLTTTDIQAPEYSGTTLTGNQTSAAGRAGFVAALNVTNINNSTSPTQMGINNITISDTNGNTAGLSSAESAHFNLNEAWLFKFDTEVTFTSAALASFDAGDQITMSATGIGSFVFNGASATISDPFNGAAIPANTEITFKNTSSSGSSIIRLDSLTVTPTPEPAALGAIIVAGLIAGRRRRVRRP